MKAGPKDAPIAGQSPGVQAVLRQLCKIAPSNHTVLLTGESGTGKTRTARWIHENSPRATGPFVTLSCAAIPADLMESEIFGHEKGAFSGAIKRKPGRVEMAHKGTLFLDEIGELPPDLQPKLLNFLQEREFFRVGGQEMLKADVRILAATNRDLGAMVAGGRFREDLYYRLNVLPVHIPPLRERPDEIPRLANFFLGRALREFSEPESVRLSMEALDVLLHHTWPGNIRELENAMYRAATLVDENGIIGPELIAPPAVSSPLPQGTSPVAPRPFAELEKEELEKALAYFGGNKSAVAAALGLSEKTVYNKIKKYRIGNFPGTSP